MPLIILFSFATDYPTSSGHTNRSVTSDTFYMYLSSCIVVAFPHDWWIFQFASLSPHRRPTTSRGEMEMQNDASICFTSCYLNAASILISSFGISAAHTALNVWMLACLCSTPFFVFLVRRRRRRRRRHCCLRSHILWFSLLQHNNPNLREQVRKAQPILSCRLQTLFIT